ncbi:MAG: hypothetical protein JWP37_1971 [Mucilaginibacter sp.]|nr:hypothetical protein [Mucilaginibacter sp.]
MKNGNFESILDAYQLTEGSIIKEKDQVELFEVGEYDADKKGYTVFPFEDGVKMDDFSLVISESELMDNYLIKTKKDNSESDDDALLSDSI